MWQITSCIDCTLAWKNCAWRLIFVN
jgi:hypothetical protein